MYKCLECGHIFDDGEQFVVIEHHPYGDTTAEERFAYCPICGGDFEKTKSCKKCGGEFLDEELIGGYYCSDCLREAVTFDSFLDFATTGAKGWTEVDTLEDFMLREIFEIDSHNEILTCSSITFKNFLRNTYNEVVKSDKLRESFTGKGELLDKIIGYMTDCELWDDFAEYLHEHEKEVRK